MTTYSWVILIVAIVIGTLFYYSYLAPGRYLKPEAVGFSTFRISESGWRLTTGGALTIVAYSSIDHTLQVRKIYVDEEAVPVSIDMTPGETARLLDNYQLSGRSGSAGSNYQLKIIVEYNDTVTALMRNDTGVLIGIRES